MPSIFTEVAEGRTGQLGSWCDMVNVCGDTFATQAFVPKNTETLILWAGVVTNERIQLGFRPKSRNLQYWIVTGVLGNNKIDDDACLKSVSWGRSLEIISVALLYSVMKLYKPCYCIDLHIYRCAPFWELSFKTCEIVREEPWSRYGSDSDTMFLLPTSIKL